jgi:hypothetical protein
MSGFMVYAVTGGGNLTIPSDAKAHSDSVWYKSGEADMVTLSAIDLDRGGSQETMIHFTGTGNPGYNEVEDCLFLTGYAPRFYTRADNRSLALNTLPSLSSETEVTLWFEKNQSTRFSLHLDASGVDAQVLLTDIKTGQSVNLTHDPSYTFTSEPTDNPDRFRLHFSHVSTNDLNQEEGFRIFSGNQGIVILNSQERSFNGEVSVYNIVGQRIFGTTLQGNHIYRLPSDETGITQGYFIVKFVTGTNILTEKFYVDHFSN